MREQPTDLNARIRELEASLRQQRELTEQARRRADVLEESARSAWRVAFLPTERTRKG